MHLVECFIWVDLSTTVSWSLHNYIWLVGGGPMWHCCISKGIEEIDIVIAFLHNSHVRYPDLCNIVFYYLISRHHIKEEDTIVYGDVKYIFQLIKDQWFFNYNFQINRHTLGISLISIKHRWSSLLQMFTFLKQMIASHDQFDTIPSFEVHYHDDHHPATV